MVGYRTYAEPRVIRRAAEMWPEGVELMPFAQSFTAPYPFPGLPSLSGDNTATGTEGLPEPFSFSLVRGDAYSVTFLFVGVNWTPTNPGGSPVVPWEQHWWAAEIRDPTNAPADPCWFYNGWIPAWGGLYPNGCIKSWFTMTKVGEFTCDAIYAEAPTAGTLVTISLASDETILWPQDYHWDLESAEERTEDEAGVVTLAGVRTWVQGLMTVVADYTITPEKV